jgi:hypothetical protein
MLRKSTGSGASAHALAHATFIISSDITAPEAWREYFGVAPNRTIVKGKPFALPSGRLSVRPGKFHLWALESRGAVYSDDLAPHLRYLKSVLGLPRADLPALAERTGARMRFFCYWDNFGGNRAPVIPDDIREMAETQGIEIDIDEYR